MYEYYLDINSDSGVVKYKIDDTSIEVVFGSGSCTHYLYTYQSAGSHNVEQMKRLARSGDGLNSFIMRNVKTRYASRW